MRSPLARVVLAGLAVAAIAAAGIVANLALLGYATPVNDPVGKLTPRATVTEPPSPTRSRAGGDDGEPELEDRDD